MILFSFNLEILEEHSLLEIFIDTQMCAISANPDTEYSNSCLSGESGGYCSMAPARMVPKESGRHITVVNLKYAKLPISPLSAENGTSGCCKCGYFS